MKGRESHPHPSPDPAWSRALVYPLYIIAVFVLLLVSFSALGATPLEKPGFILLLNASFITAASIWIAALALRGYLRSGLIEMLLAGSGLLAHGSSALVAGLILSANRGNYDAMAVYNLGAVCAAVFHLAAALRIGRSAPGKSAPSIAKAVLAYGGVLALIGLFAAATRLEIIPIAFLAPAGTTPARQPVLTAAVAMLAAAAGLLVTEARRRASLALRCYGLGLALIALGLSCASVVTAGGPLGWTGRISQYLGYLYLLAAFLTFVRDARRKRMDLNEAVAEFFRQSEGHYRTLVEALTSAVVSVNREGRVFMWNSTAEAVFGFTYAEIAGKPLPDLVAAGESGAATLWEVLARKPEAYLEMELRRKDGSVFAANVSVLAPGREIDGVTSLVISDVTERRQIEELIQSEARFPEQNPNPVLRAARSGELLYANRSAAGLLVQWKSAVGARVPAAVLRVVAATLNCGEDREMKIRCGERDLSLLFVPIAEEDYVNIYGLDITDRKKAEQALQDSEEALRRINEKLEEKVRERTAELAETVLSLETEIEQRHRAEKELRLANEKLRFRAGQLRALAGELTLVEQRERRRMAGILHDHLQQQLVGAMLRVSVISRGAGAPVKQASREIEGLLREAIRVSRSLSAELSPPILHEAGLAAGLRWLGRWMADTHGLQVDLEMDEDIPATAEDVKLLLFESTRELLFNAVKHAGVPAAVVKLRQIEGRALQITVSDRGRGFDPARMKPAGVSGSGFGLFSIRERISLVGGSLEAGSAVGQGSRFILTAPLAGTGAVALDRKSADGIVPKPAAGSSFSVNPPKPKAKIRVLVADDHAVMREGLVRLLGQEPDLEVIGEAHDGQVAFDLTGKLMPDVILMDMSMPKVDGIEATRAIHSAYADVRIIGLSLFEEAERAGAVKDAGAVGYLSKGGPAADLIAAIRACMQGSDDGLEPAPPAR